MFCYENYNNNIQTSRCERILFIIVAGFNSLVLVKVKNKKKNIKTHILRI